MNKPTLTDALSATAVSSVETEQVRLLNNAASISVSGSLIIAAVTAWVLWPVIPHTVVVAWVSLLAAAQFIRLLLYFAIRRTTNPLLTRHQCTAIRSSVLLSGLAWGALPTFLFPADLMHQVFLPFVAAGVTGAALAALAADRIAVMLFVVPTLVPLITRLFLTGNTIEIAMAGLVSLYLGFLIVAAGRNERAFIHTYALRAQLDLQNHELREAQRLARIGSWALDVTSGKITWSDMVYTIFGRDQNEFTPDIQTYYTRLLHPDDVKAVQQHEQLAYRQPGHHHQIDHRIILPDGRVRWVHIEGVATVDASGQPQHIVGTVQDITERKAIEQNLRDSQQQLDTAQEIARLGYFRSDLRSGALEWSDRLVRMLGYEPGEITPSMEIFTASIHPDYRERVLGTMAQAFSTTYQVAPGERATLPILEYRALRRDGAEIWLRSEAQAEVDNTGKPVLVQGTAQDITELKRTELALIAARDEAEQASRAKSEFLSSMSHELRTPMNAILGFSQLMNLDEALPDTHRENLHEIMKAGHHLLQLINEVLDLAKVESGQIELSLETVDIEPVVDECLALMSTLADKRDIRINYTGIQAAAVRADHMRLKQALLNLLSNAVKYNRHGGRVTLTVTQTNRDTLRIEVSDTGPGIPAHQLADLFQPFNRLNAEHSEVEGTGIGLSITRRIIDMMGGRIGVSSEVGVGSTFWIELPLDDVTTPARDQEQPTSTNSRVASPAANTQHLVLYIEDNPANLKLVAQILRNHEHIHLITAHTPELGIELARTRHPDLILLDINLPGMDGFAVLEIVKRDPALQNIPVVAVSANAMPSDLERGQVAGFTDYLTKPLNIAQFHSVIDRYLHYSPAH